MDYIFSIYVATTDMRDLSVCGLKYNRMLIVVFNIKLRIE